MKDKKISSEPIMLGAVDMFTYELNEESEIVVLKTGEWTHAVFGDFQVSQEMMDEMISVFSEFRETGRPDPAVDIDHSKGEAVGWFKELKRKGDQLVAKIEWNDLGKKTIENKRYRYFSPEFSRNYVEPETGKEFGPAILGGALTNRPFLRSLGEVTLSEDGEEELTNKHYILMPKENEVIKEEQKAEPTITLSEYNKLQEENLKLKESQEKAVKELSELQLASRKQEAESFTETLMFNEESGKGRILPKHKDKVVNFMLSLKEDKAVEFKELLGELKEVESAMFDEQGGSGEGQPAGHAPEGVDPGTFALNERAVQLQSEKPELTIEQALLLAEKELN